jgi:hypothetical protein
MFLSLYDGVTNVLCVSLLSHDRYQYDSLILPQTDLSIPSSTLATADVLLTSRMNAWKQIFIFPLRYYANCVSTTLTFLLTLKVSISFTVTVCVCVCVCVYVCMYIQDDSGGICNTLGNNSMCDSKQNSSYEHGSDSKVFLTQFFTLATHGDSHFVLRCT